MKLMTLKQYMKMTKPALIRKIIKTLRTMPKKKLAIACYNITKSKLPQLKTIKQKALPKRKTKTKKVEYDYENPFWSKKLGAYDYPIIRKASRKRKTKRKARFKKGSPEAKRYMAKLRKMRT